MSEYKTCYSVELAQVTKQYGDVTAVDCVDLAIERGRFFSFLGPSGCGKTTTLRMIAGLEKPDGGEIRINGERVNDTPPYDRNVSTVFQRLALFPHMSVGENIAFGLKIQRQSHRQIAPKVREMLELVRLPGLEKRYPDQLSGGQQQRVALARSLVLEPEVLLLDEPLAALDRKLRKEMQVELRRIQQEVGITFIYVTHDQKEALSMSDRIAVMNESKIVQMGSPQEIYERPQTAFVADFLGATNFLSGELLTTDSGSCLRTAGGLCIYIDTCNADGAQGSTRKLLALRPETIDISQGFEPNGMRNCFRGRVLDKLYLGDATEFHVELNMVDQLKVHVDGHRQASQIVEGSQVFVHWESTAGSIVPDA